MKPKRMPATRRAIGKRNLTTCLLSICVLLCGSTWDWSAQFTAPTRLPLEDAVDSELILSFGSVVNVDDLQIYLTEPLIAEHLVNGIGANLSARVYDGIELPDMTEETLGRKIVRIIFGRLFL